MLAPLATAARGAQTWVPAKRTQCDAKARPLAPGFMHIFGCRRVNRSSWLGYRSGPDGGPDGRRHVGYVMPIAPWRPMTTRLGGGWVFDSPAATRRSAPTDPGRPGRRRAGPVGGAETPSGELGVGRKNRPMRRSTTPFGPRPAAVPVSTARSSAKLGSSWPLGKRQPYVDVSPTRPGPSGGCALRSRVRAYVARFLAWPQEGLG